MTTLNELKTSFLGKLIISKTGQGAFEIWQKKECISIKAISDYYHQFINVEIAMNYYLPFAHEHFSAWNVCYALESFEGSQ